MKILILTDYYPPDRIGGVGAIAAGLADAYRAQGHEVWVLTTGTPRRDEANDRVIRSSHRLSAGVVLNNLIAFRLIRRHRIDLVHLHQSATTLVLPMLRFLRARPVVITSLQVSYLSEAREMRAIRVAGREFAPNPGEYIERFLLAPGHVVLDFIGYALADRVTVVSEDNRRELEETFGRVIARPVAVVPNGIAGAASATHGFRDAELEARLQGRVVFTYIGVFRVRKRVATLLTAFREVARRAPDAMLLLVGGGRRYEERLRALAEEFGISDRVVFAGPAPAARVPYYLALTDVFCLLSSYEGMPMAMLEAMHAGKAIIATNGYGMRDLLRDGDAGMLVPTDDVPAIARAMEELADDPRRRDALGRNARSRVGSRFTWGTIAREYLELARAT